MRAAPPARRIAPALRLAALRLPLTALAALSAPAAAQDLGPLPELARQGTLDRTSEGLVRVAWELPAATVYPGQVVTLALVAELDREFLAERMVQPFTRSLDVPVAFDDPPLGLERIVDFGAHATDGARVAFGERVVRAEESKRVVGDGGDHGNVLRLHVDAQVLAELPGDVVLPEPILRFASADEFREELLGRTPVDARLALVRGQSATLSIAPFPEAGRAPDFEGLIGEFALRVSAEPRELRLGEVLRLRLEIDGPVAGAVDRLPRLDDLRGLHLVSRRVSPTPSGARVDAELRVERASVRVLPAIEVHSFLPETASYAVARSEAVPLRVLAAEPPLEATKEERTPWSVWATVATGLAIAFLVAARRRRSARRDGA